MASIPPSDLCRTCGTSSGLKRCGQCSKQIGTATNGESTTVCSEDVPHYCSTDCQRQDWRRRHSRECCRPRVAWPADAESCAFDELKAAPRTYRPSLRWDHDDWKKKSGMVMRREVLEAFSECLGFWPTSRELEGAPDWLTHDEFLKFCYHSDQWNRKEENGEVPPDGYIPIDYDTNEDDRKAWQKRAAGGKMRQSLRKRYEIDNELAIFGAGHNGIPKLSPESEAYLSAVKKCDVDAVRSMVANPPVSLDPNCLHGTGREFRRNSTVSVALHRVLETDGTSASRDDALECLRLVCGVPGVDVNLDTWIGSLPPVIQAMEALDLEAVRILVEVGKARMTFEDVVFIEAWRQWCTKAMDPPYKHGMTQKHDPNDPLGPMIDFPLHCPTVLHWITFADGPKTDPKYEDKKVLDRARAEMVKLLVELGVDPMAMISEPPPGVAVPEEAKQVIKGMTAFQFADMCLEDLGVPKPPTYKTPLTCTRELAGPVMWCAVGWELANQEATAMEKMMHDTLVNSAGCLNLSEYTKLIGGTNADEFLAIWHSHRAAVCRAQCEELQSRLTLDKCKAFEKKLAEYAAPSLTYTEGESPPSLLDLDNLPRNIIGSFLYPDEWCLLRFCCSSASDWPKPAPQLTFAAVYFSMSNKYDETFHGMATNLHAAVEAAVRAAGTNSNGYDEYSFQFDFLNFSTDPNGRRIVPLVEYKDSDYYGNYDSSYDVMDVGKQLFGVSAVECSKLISADHRGYTDSMFDFLQSEETPHAWVPQFKLWALLKWLDSGPNRPRGYCNLRYVHSRRALEAELDSMYQVWYNPRCSDKVDGFCSQKEPDGGIEPEYVLFQSTVLWDTC